MAGSLWWPFIFGFPDIYRFDSYYRTAFVLSCLCNEQGGQDAEKEEDYHNSVARLTEQQNELL